MTAKQNTIQTGLANNTTLTAANSDDGGAGDAFTTVPGASTGRYVTDTSALGTLSLEFTPVAAALNDYFVWNDGTGGTSWTISMLVKLGGNPSATTQFLIAGPTASGTAARLHINTSGQLVIVNSAASVVGTLTTALTTAWTWINFFGTCDATTGTATVKTYSFSTGTLIDSLALTNINTNTSVGRGIYGKFDAAPSMAAYRIGHLRQNCQSSTEYSVISAGNNYTPSPADPGGGTDAASKQLDAVRVQGDAAGATDSAVSALDVPKAAADSAGATDSATSDLTITPADPLDQAGAVDAVSFVRTVTRTQDDPAGAADAASRRLDTVEPVSDTAGATDSATPSLSNPGAASNNAEGGTGNGVAVTVGNSGGASGNAFLTATSMTFSTAAPQYGTYCYHGSGATGSTQFLTLRAPVGATSYSTHINFRYNATPSAEGIWFDPQDDTGVTMARLHITTGNQLKCYNAAGAATWTSGTATIPYTMVPGTDYTLQIVSTVNATTGTFNVQLKPKAAPGTVLGSASMVGNTGTGSCQRYTVGKLTSALSVTGGFDFDEITIITGSTDWIEDPVTLTSPTPSDPADGTDVAAATQSVTRSAADAAAASDSAATTVGPDRTISDTAAGTDVASLLFDFVVSDTAVTTDTSGPQALAWDDSYDDVGAGSDVVIQSVEATTVDTASGADSASSGLDAVRSAADAASGADSTTRPFDTIRSAADAATGSDTTALVTDFARTATDPAPAADTVATSIDATRSAADAASGADAAASVEDFPRTPAENAAATDAASTVASSTRTTGDGAAASDTIDVQLQSATGQTLNDTGLGSDLVDWSMDRIVTVDDFLAAIDAAQREAVVGLNAADNATGADSTSAGWGYARLVADLAGAPDDASTGDRNYVSSKDEPVGAVDRVSIEYGPTPADLGAAGDILLLERVAAADESLPAEDAVDATSDADRSAADQAGARDAVTARLIPLFDPVESRSIHATLSDDSHLVALLRS